MTALLRTRPRKVCPTCRTELDGGPIRYRCPSCACGVSAADALTEVDRPAAAQAAGGFRSELRAEIAKRLPNAASRVAIAAAALETGHAVVTAAGHLGALS